MKLVTSKKLYLFSLEYKLMFIHQVTNLIVII